MSDNISRREAIEQLKKNWREEPMEDRQVSLKQVLDTLEDYTDSNTLDGYEDSRTLIEILKALPSAQPEPCDDPRADVYYLAEKIGIHRLYALVVELRGEPEPCEDAVSRKDVVKFLDDWTSALNANCHHQSMADLKIIKNDFENLPSAQPEPCEDAASREAVLDMLHRECSSIVENFMKEKINAMPSVTVKEHPEIIHCRDCKFTDGEKPIADGRYWCVLHGSFMYFCSDAERREEGGK